MLNHLSYSGRQLSLAGLILLVIGLNLPACVVTIPEKNVKDVHSLFNLDRVATVRIVMADKDWQYMRKNASQERYFKADLWYEKNQVPDVAVRIKGLNSLQGALQAGSIRFGLKVDINFFNSERSLYGVKKLNFNNGYNDPTFIREVLGYELYRALDVPTPRYAFTDLWVNESHLGLYLMVEQIDTVYIEQNFSYTTGNLYKPEGWACHLRWTAADLPAENSTIKNTAARQQAIASINLGGGNLQAIIDTLEPGYSAASENTTSAFPGGIPPPGGMPGMGPPGMSPPGGMPGMGPPGMPPPGGQPWYGPPPFPGEGMPAPGMPPPGSPPPGAVPPLPAGLQAEVTQQIGQMQFLARGMPPGGADNPPPGQRYGNLLELMGLKTNENRPDHTLLFRLLEVLNKEPDATFPAEIEKVLDVDEVLRFLAVSTAIVHLDNYTGMGHNYYLYDDGGRFVILPWDLNLSFGTFKSPGPTIPFLRSLPVTDFLIDKPTTADMSERPLVKRLLSHQAYLDKYHGYLQELIDGPFSSNTMNRRIDELAAFIRPYVEKDSLKFYSLEDFEISLTTDIAADKQKGDGMMSVPGLKDFIAARNESIGKQLKGQMPGISTGSRGNKGKAMMVSPGIRENRNPAGGNR